MQHLLSARAQRVTLACIVAAAAPWLADTARAEGLPPKKPHVEQPGKVRPPRWWLDIYAHTMQEQAFILWMDRTCGGTAWRHTMQEARVNALWQWWCIAVWDPSHGTGDTAGGRP